MNPTTRSSIYKRSAHFMSHLRIERFVVFFCRLVAVVLFFGLFGYWAAAALGELLFTEELRGTRSLLSIPLSASVRPDNVVGRSLTLKEFVGGDPFLVHVPSIDEEGNREITARELYDLEGIRLTGTIPGISVWIQEENKPQTIVLKGQMIKDYELTAVENDRIILQKGQAQLTVLLRYSGKPANAKTIPSSTTRSVQRTVAAARPGQQGAISREMVNQLLMDPLEEMKKFRLRPKFDGDMAQGVEVQWLDEKSLLTSLGVKAGDVVQSVNGVQIRNMGDIVNVINSLMSGNTFDVQVVREGKPEMLNYNIR